MKVTKTRKNMRGSMLPIIQASRIQELNALRNAAILAGIDHEPPPPKKADQCEPDFARQFHRKAAGCGHRRENRDSRRQRLLHNLEAAAAAYHQHAAAQRPSSF